MKTNAALIGAPRIVELDSVSAQGCLCPVIARDDYVAFQDTVRTLESETLPFGEREEGRGMLQTFEIESEWILHKISDDLIWLPL